MEIVVNDTNIFIDLHSIRLLDQFFELPITVHTVDFVINELTDEVQFKYMGLHQRDISNSIAGRKRNQRRANHKQIRE